MSKEIDVIDLVEKIGFKSILKNNYSVVATYNGYYKEYRFVKSFTINTPLPIYELYLCNINVFNSNNKEGVIIALKTIFKSELRKYKINKLYNNLEI